MTEKHGTGGREMHPIINEQTLQFEGDMVYSNGCHPSRIIMVELPEENRYKFVVWMQVFPPDGPPYCVSGDYYYDRHEAEATFDERQGRLQNSLCQDPAHKGSKELTIVQCRQARAKHDLLGVGFKEIAEEYGITIQQAVEAVRAGRAAYIEELEAAVEPALDAGKALQEITHYANAKGYKKRQRLDHIRSVLNRYREGLK